MSKNQIPIYLYPGGNLVIPPTQNVTYKWINELGGGELDGPIDWGKKRPDGKQAHGGVMTSDSNGYHTVEYHYCPGHRH